MKQIVLLTTILFFSVAAKAQSTAKEKKETKSVQAAVKENKTVKMENETFGPSKTKTADKQQKAMSDFIKGRESNPKENDPKIPKNKTVKKAEDPDQGGEIIKKKNVSVKKN